MNTSTVFTSIESRNAIWQYSDILLEQVSGNFDKTNVSTRFGDTFIIACGNKNAPPLVLLHGSSMNSVMWAKDMQVYGKFFRVYAPDLPGEPGRSVEEQLRFDTSDYADCPNQTSYPRKCTVTC